MLVWKEQKYSQGNTCLVNESGGRFSWTITPVVSNNKLVWWARNSYDKTMECLPNKEFSSEFSSIEEAKKFCEESDSGCLLTIPKKVKFRCTVNFEYEAASCHYDVDETLDIQSMLNEMAKIDASNLQNIENLLLVMEGKGVKFDVTVSPVSYE